eukprot:scaffold2663_cov156-Skeletonema_marinoi.AAC.4
MSNYLATRKILRDKKKKPELPTPSALETASICHECPFALVSNVGPNTNMNCRPRETDRLELNTSLSRERAKGRFSLNFSPFPKRGLFH